MILVTGGAGYIGSHCVLELLKQKKDVVVFDNLSTGHIETIEELKKNGNLVFVQGDLSNLDDLKNLFSSYKINSVVHFAAFSQVGESMKNPQKYYSNNVLGTLNLLKTMVEFNVLKIVFSSTAAVYGEPKYVPIDENHPKNPINPYGKTKLMVENIMDDFDYAYNLKSVRLRYFNVIGANKDAIIGEWHNPETHLIPNVLKSTFANGKTFEMYGDDYNTKDGTCIRDYINIEDLIDAHLLALDYLNKTNKTTAINLGTKEGSSVKEIFDVCKVVANEQIPTKIMPRREGDPAILVADNKKAVELLAWKPKRTLKESVQSAYNWEKKLSVIKK